MTFLMSFSAVIMKAISNFFFFNDTATTEIYTLSLHDALPISRANRPKRAMEPFAVGRPSLTVCPPTASSLRSEEHTSELQSQSNIVCRLLLEKKIPNVQIALDA